MKRRPYFKGRQAPGGSAFRSGFTVSGRLVAHRDGFGFVIPDQKTPKIQGDIFIAVHAMSDAMHGDRVLVGKLRLRADGRVQGSIEQVIERTQTTIVGRFQLGDRSHVVIPYDERITVPVIIPAHKKTSIDQIPGAQPLPTPEEMDGMVVEVEITRFPTLSHPATGRVIEVIGREGEFGVDVGIVIRKHHLRHRFPPEVAVEAAAVSDEIPREEIRRRKDFRRLPIVTIDGETARDFDDAVYVEILPNGNYELQVHIADVSYYVLPGTALDREARLRGTSVYFPDRAVPMLPHELSTGICSLNPNEDRLVQSVIMEIDRNGGIVRTEFHEGVIKSAERMTYTAVNLVLEDDPGMRERYREMAPRFEMMRDLALILNRKRHGRGSIDFDLPEPVIALDELGIMVAITRSERNVAHRLIEEFMLAANEVVAEEIERAGFDSLHRIHEKPDPQKVIAFEEIAAGFGYTLGVGPLPVKSFSTGKDKGRGKRGRTERVEVSVGEIDISPRNYQRLTEKIAGKPEERILSYLMLRSLKQAKYSESNEGHFALATSFYAHFTSPIRRYPDLIVHRILRFLIESRSRNIANDSEDAGIQVAIEISRLNRREKKHRKKSNDLSGPVSKMELQEIATESSESERRAQAAERELIDWKKARFMSDKLGDEFDALIISVAKYGFFVELLDMFIEGLVPIETLNDDRYFFREHQQQLVGERSRRRYRMGDRVRVRLDRVGEMGGKMNFSVVEEEPFE